MLKLRINGEVHDVDVDPATPLLWVLRDNLNLTGTKYGCGINQCGACTVMINGHAVRSCATSVSQAEAFEIITIEGLSPDRGHPLQQAWIEEDVPQCGYCQSGQLMAAAALLRQKARPTDAEIDKAMTNVCRCGTYQRIRKAIHAAAGKVNG
jgi:isoquinoline 1-oxidoreductase alpha subunit